MCLLLETGIFLKIRNFRVRKIIIPVFITLKIDDLDVKMIWSYYFEFYVRF